MKPESPNRSAGIAGVDYALPGSAQNGHSGDPSLYDFGQEQGSDRLLAQLRLLWQNRRFLARVAGMGLLLSTIFAFAIPNQYQSTVRIMPPDSQGGSGLAMAAAVLSGGGASGLASTAGDLLGLKNNSDLMVGVITSRTVEDELIQKFDLKKLYGDRRIEDARRHLSEYTDVSVDRKSQIIAVRVTDKSPRRAQEMAQAYVDSLNRTLAEVSTSSARRERIFLENRLQGVSKDLETAEVAFSQFSSKNSAIDIKEQGKAMLEASAMLEGELIAARSELEGLRQIYADSNVRVRSEEARVNELEVQLKRVGGDSDSASPDKGSSDGAYPSIRQLPLLGVPYADFYRQARLQEAIYETLTKEYELAKVQEAKEIATAKVLDAPNFPEKKSFPPHMILMALGTFVSFTVAVIWVFASTKWGETSDADPRKAFASEVYQTARGALPWGRKKQSD